MVRLFAVVKMRVDGVLEQVHDAVAGHDEHRPQRRTHAQALGSHLQQGRSHQEARAQRDEIAQIALDAASTHQHQSAGHVGQRGQDAENQGEPEHA